MDPVTHTDHHHKHAYEIMHEHDHNPNYQSEKKSAFLIEDEHRHDRLI
jgi:hypothetical protein